MKLIDGAHGVTCAATLALLALTPAPGVAQTSPATVLHRPEAAERIANAVRLEPSAVQSFTERFVAFARSLPRRQQTLVSRLIAAAQNAPPASSQTIAVDGVFVAQPDRALARVAGFDGTAIGQADPRPRPPGGDVAIGPKQDDPRHPSIPQDNEKPPAPGAGGITAPGEHGGVRPHDPHAYDPMSPNSDVRGVPRKEREEFARLIRDFGLSLPQRDRGLLGLLLQRAADAPPAVRPAAVPGGLPPAMEAAVARGLGLR